MTTDTDKTCSYGKSDWSVGAWWDPNAMSEKQWHGYRQCDAYSGLTMFRVRGARVCNANSGLTEYRIRDDGRIVHANSGKLAFRIRDDGRVVEANSGQLRYRLRD